MRLQRFHAGRIDIVDPPRSLAPVIDQARILQNPQMLRNRRPANGEIARQVDHWKWVIGDAVQDREPRRIADRVQSRL